MAVGTEGWKDRSSGLLDEMCCWLRHFVAGGGCFCALDYSGSYPALLAFYEVVYVAVDERVEDIGNLWQDPC